MGKSKSVPTFLFFSAPNVKKKKKIVSNIGQSDTTATSPLGGKFPNGRSSSSSVLLLYYTTIPPPSTRLRGWQMHYESKGA
jgi:hypothetical protein